MCAKSLFTANGKYFTQNGAPALQSCGISSADKGVAVALSAQPDTPERMNIWYLRAPGDSAMHYLYFRDLVDIRVCALLDGGAQQGVRLTGKNGELHVFDMKSPLMAQNLLQKLLPLAKGALEENRAIAQQLNLPQEDAPVFLSVAAKEEQTPEKKAAERKKNGLHILGIVLQGIGYLLLIGMIGACINDQGGTDWSGAWIGVLVFIGLIIGGTVLAKKN